MIPEGFFGGGGWHSSGTAVHKRGGVEGKKTLPSHDAA